MSDDLFDKMIKGIAFLEKNKGKQVIYLNRRAMLHVNWLIANGHVKKEELSIEAVMAADKKLGITPWDWDKYS